MEDKGSDPGYRGDLNRRCATIAEVLRPAGYGTYAVGKWHVTKATQPGRAQGQLAAAARLRSVLRHDHRRGQFLRSRHADPRQQDDLALCRSGVSSRSSITTPTRSAITPCGSSASIIKDQPTSRSSCTSPTRRPTGRCTRCEEDIAKYKGKYDGGYEPIRRARFERPKQLGLIEPKRSCRRTAGDWDNVANKAWEARCMEVYAAMIDRMDQGIGRDRGGAGAHRPARQHADLLPARQRRLCRDGGPASRRPSVPGSSGPPSRRCEPQGRRLSSNGRAADADARRLQRPHRPTARCPARTTPTSPMVKAGRTSATRPSANTSTGSMKGASRTPLIVHWPAGIKASGELRTHARAT